MMKEIKYPIHSHLFGCGVEFHELNWRLVVADGGSDSEDELHSPTTWSGGSAMVVPLRRANVTVVLFRRVATMEVQSEWSV
ncbi:uncharacterized protein G2W53_010948 [Senna tora]|uniref:Uncharacterized protein n=1 Tax=Senna tora TaxID=362788 RepID=A0A834X185_9FABA|nr:uncharacterized protein G2W53_010948 [Senna tora]